MDISSLDSVPRYMGCVPRNALPALACFGDRRENPQAFARQAGDADLIKEILGMPDLHKASFGHMVFGVFAACDLRFQIGRDDR